MARGIIGLAIVAGAAAAVYTAWDRMYGDDEPEPTPTPTPHPTDPEPQEDPTGPPPVPGLPDPPSGQEDACKAAKGTPAQEAILSQLPEPYQCNARTMIASDPNWKTNLGTAALNAEALGLTQIADLLRQLAGQPAGTTPINPIPNLGGLGGVHPAPTPGGGWPATEDPACPGVPLQSTALEGMLANIPEPFRCQARTVIANNDPNAWPNLVAMLATAVRPINGPAADSLLALAEYGQTH